VLPDHAGKCSRLHGHSYRFEVAIRGPVQNSGPVVVVSEVESGVRGSVPGTPVVFVVVVVPVVVVAAPVVAAAAVVVAAVVVGVEALVVVAAVVVGVVVAVATVTVATLPTVTVTDGPVSAPAYDGRQTKTPTAMAIRVTSRLRLVATLPATNAPSSGLPRHPTRPSTRCSRSG